MPVDQQQKPAIDPIVIGCVPSTNRHLAALTTPEHPLPHGTTVIALHQSAGRGRLGRHWDSPARKSLLQSTLLDLPAAAPLTWVSLLAGLAVRDTILENYPSLDPNQLSLKWPNDLLLDGRKVSGILGEVLQSDPESNTVVLGIGLNIAQSEAELAPWGAASLAAAGAVVGTEALEIAELTSWSHRINAAIQSRLNQLTHEPQQTAADLLAASATSGQTLTAVLPDGTEIQGVESGVTADGALRISVADGHQEELSAADVTIGSSPRNFATTVNTHSTCEECL